MSENTSKSAGSAHVAAGSQNEIQNEIVAGEKVAFESFNKAVEQKKRAQEQLAEMAKRLEAFESEKRAREEEELTKKGEVQKLLALRDEELQKIRGESESLKRTIQDGLKLDAFLNAVPGNLDRDFYQLVDLDSIVMDPQTGRPDPTSVQQLAKTFEKKFSRLIDRQTGVNLPNQAAANGSGGISYDDWLKLPAKEMKAKMKDVINAKK